MPASSNILLLHRPVPAGSRALFLDRDGVINIDKGYVSVADHVMLQPGAASMIAAFNAAGWPVIVVSNQSGIGRGYFSGSTALAVQERIEALLAEAGAWLDAVFLCGAHPDQDDALSAWRKPEPGMLLTAGRLFDVRLEHSILVGDKISDLQAAAKAGLRGGFLVGAVARSEVWDLVRCGLPARHVDDLTSIRPDRLDFP